MTTCNKKSKEPNTILLNSGIIKFFESPSKAWITMVQTQFDYKLKSYSNITKPSDNSGLNLVQLRVRVQLRHTKNVGRLLNHWITTVQIQFDYDSNLGMSKSSESASKPLENCGRNLVSLRVQIQLGHDQVFRVVF
jgi:hypothetical protein